MLLFTVLLAVLVLGLSGADGTDKHDVPLRRTAPRRPPYSRTRRISSLSSLATRRPKATASGAHHEHRGKVIRVVALRPVIVGVDGSDASRHALLWAVGYAKCSGAPLEALAAWQTPSNYGFPAYYDDVDFARQTNERLEETVRAIAPDLNIGLRVEQAHPAAALVAASEQAQLLVVGQRGHGEFHDRLLGSVSQHCVHHAHCSVVVVRGRQADAG